MSFNYHVFTLVENLKLIRALIIIKEYDVVKGHIEELVGRFSNFHQLRILNKQIEASANTKLSDIADLLVLQIDTLIELFQVKILQGRCTETWSRLVATSANNVRFCDICYRHVHLVEDECEVNDYLESDICISHDLNSFILTDSKIKEYQHRGFCIINFESPNDGDCEILEH